MPSGKKRMSINKIKLHEFFKPIRFSDIEKERIPIPKVNMREPKSGDFDVIDPDSDDEDFDHEYRELYQQDNNNGDSDSDASSPNFDHLKESIQQIKPDGKGNQTHQVNDGMNRDNFAAQIMAG